MVGLFSVDTVLTPLQDDATAREVSGMIR